MEMDKSGSIFVAGSSGLVGSAITRKLKSEGYSNIITTSHSDLNLTRQREVYEFFNRARPEYVFLAAAKVGGIRANYLYPGDFIYDNLMIQSNVIDASYRYGVRKLVFLGSSCIYPKFAKQPIKEEYLLSGPLEMTNEAYAVAKIAGIKMCQAYNRQYGTNFISIMPTNLYGPGDNFDPESSHVLPALIRKFHESKVRGFSEVLVWGTGTPRREFLYVDDLADACVFLMNTYDSPEIINVGCGEDISILDLACIVKDVIGYQGRIVFDSEKPDGTPRKNLDVSRLFGLGWRPSVGLREGISMTYEWFKESVG
ncbi:MAG: GDP-L-fucose synthase [Candidatus Methanomethyliaceae archaeon]